MKAILALFFLYWSFTALFLHIENTRTQDEIDRLELTING